MVDGDDGRRKTGKNTQSRRGRLNFTGESFNGGHKFQTSVITTSTRSQEEDC